jgi:hypothetical protein
MFMMLSLTVAVGVSRSLAQTNPIFLQLGQAKGALYKPDSGPAPQLRKNIRSSLPRCTTLS